VGRCQIAFAVHNALGGLLGARQGALETAAKSGDMIAELLRKAAAAYEKGDERSAGKRTRLGCACRGWSGVCCRCSRDGGAGRLDFSNSSRGSRATLDAV